MLNPQCLQLKVPKENIQGPAAMESVLIGVGEIFRQNQIKLSLEILIKDGFLHFVAVCPKEYNNLVKGQLFSQYPNIEIEEIPDYSVDFTSNTSIATLKLAKSDGYPVKTYKDLETDFIASLSGLSASVEKDEVVAIQFILRPINRDSLNFRLNEIWRSSWRNFIRRGSSVKEILREKGYVEILTDNADNFDYTVTEIQVKNDKKQLGEMMKNDLKDYITSPKITVLDDKEASDLVLIFAADFK